MTLTPDERHAVAGELRWLARRREQNAVMSPDWLRQRADWIEASGERRGPVREREKPLLRPNGLPDPWRLLESPSSDDESMITGGLSEEVDPNPVVLRWGEPS